jgi:hypothetical protein
MDSLNCVCLKTPYIYTIPQKTITTFKLEVVNVKLFTSCSVQVQLYDQSLNLVEVKYLDISGKDYTNWSHDDNTLIDIVKLKLGVS